MSATMRALRVALWFFIATRILSYVLAIGGSFWLIDRYAAKKNPDGYIRVDNRALDVFVRWDATRYLDIAEQGYGPVYPENRAFFPLYPSLLRALGGTVERKIVLGALINGVALLLALWLLLYTYRHEVDQRWLAFAIVVTPGSFFFSMLYTEALFLLFFAIVLWAYKQDWPWLAAPFGALASVLRPQGILIAGLMGLHGLRRPWWLLASLVACSGLAYTMYDGYRATGDALVFLHAQSAWRAEPTWHAPIDALIAFDHDPDYYATALIALFLVGCMFRRKAPMAEALMGLGFVLMPLSTGTLMSFPRFWLGMVPLHVELARESTPRLARLLYAIPAVIWFLVESFRLGRAWTFV